MANVGPNAGHLAYHCALSTTYHCLLFRQQRKGIEHLPCLAQGRVMVEMDTAAALKALTVQQISYMLCVTVLPVLGVEGL